MTTTMYLFVAEARLAFPSLNTLEAALALALAEAAAALEEAGL